MNPISFKPSSIQPFAHASISDCKRLPGETFQPAFIEHWLEIAHDADDIKTLTSVLHQLSLSGLSETDIYRMVDNSPFSFRDWTEATLCFFHKQEAPLSPELTSHGFGYLNCCAESAAQSLILESFPTLVEHMLNTYGFDEDKMESREEKQASRPIPS